MRALLKILALSLLLCVSASAHHGRGGASSTPPPPTTPTLLTVLQNLSSSAGGSTPYLLTGQHTNYYVHHTSTAAALGGSYSGGSTPASAYYQGTSAQYQPAIMGLAIQGGRYDATANSTEQFGINGGNVVDLANAFIAAGGIVELSGWMNNPANPLQGYQGDGGLYTISGGPYNPWPNIITQNGNSVITTWQSNLSALVTLLNQINGPVILRPFLEMNISGAGTFWWGIGGYSGAPTGAQFQTLWTQTQAYINSRITNPKLTLLWAFSVNECCLSVSQSAYPGNGNVDILGYDAYTDTPGSNMVSDGTYAWFTSIGKPIIITETGSGTFSAPDGTSYATILQNIKTNTPKAIGLVIWTMGWPPPQSNSAAQITSLMTDPAVINLPSVPAFH